MAVQIEPPSEGSTIDSFRYLSTAFRGDAGGHALDYLQKYLT
jgi:hypothetical protein